MLLSGFVFTLFTGCASFRKSETPDLQPFTDQTVAMAGDIYFSMSGVPTVYIRTYYDRPEVERLAVLGNDAVVFMRAIINYSMQVVTLSQSSKSGPEQAQALADYVDEVLDLSDDQKEVPLTVSSKTVREIIDQIAAQEDLLGGLRAAQPLIDEVGRVAGEFLDRYKSAFVDAVDAVGAAIDEDYGPVLQYQKTIRLQQDITVDAYERLVEYAVTEDEARKEELLQGFIKEASNTAAFDKVKIEDGLTIQEIWKVEEVYLERMARISEQRASIAPEIEVYRKAREELETVADRADATIIKARSAVFVWVRVHRRMSQGIVHPADINLWEVTRKVVDAAPLPF
jgi:hypothetical protein